MSSDSDNDVIDLDREDTAGTVSYSLDKQDSAATLPYSLDSQRSDATEIYNLGSPKKSQTLTSDPEKLKKIEFLSNCFQGKTKLVNREFYKMDWKKKSIYFAACPWYQPLKTIGNHCRPG